MRAFTRRAFLKGSGTLVLAAAASGLLCGAGEAPSTVLGAVDGIRVHDITARLSNGFNSNYRLEVHFTLENTNASTAYFLKDNFSASVSGKSCTYAGLNKWNGSRYVQDIQLAPGEQQLISYSAWVEPADYDTILQNGFRITFSYGVQAQTFAGRPLFGEFGGGFTAEPVQTLSIPSVGGLRVHSVRVTPRSSNYGEVTFTLRVENTNAFPVQLYWDNFVVQIGDERIDHYLNTRKVWVSGATSSSPIAAGEWQTVLLSCSLQRSSSGLYNKLTQGSAPWTLTLFYGQEKRFFTGYATSPDTYSVGETQSTALPSVGGVQFSGLWSTDSYTQQGNYTLHLNFTMQNLTDETVSLPIPDLHPSAGLQSKLALKFDGSTKYLYGPFYCEHDEQSKPKRIDSFETLAPRETRLTEVMCSLTESEHASLYTQSHTVELSFVNGGESLTIRFDPRTGAFSAV